MILSLRALHVPGTFQVEQTPNIGVLLLLNPAEVALGCYHNSSFSGYFPRLFPYLLFFQQIILFEM